MKTLFSILILTLISTQSFAVVTDEFECEFKIVDNLTQQESLHRERVSVARVPMSIENPTPNVVMTTGSGGSYMGMKANHGILDATFTFHYSHAVKMGPDGRPVEGRQTLCLALAGNYCEKGDRTCMSAVKSCGTYMDPFDPVRGWTPTAIVDGVPAFLAQAMAPVTTSFGNRTHPNAGTATAKCTYAGTLH